MFKDFFGDYNVEISKKQRRLFLEMRFGGVFVAAGLAGVGVATTLYSIAEVVTGHDAERNGISGALGLGLYGVSGWLSHDSEATFSRRALAEEVQVINTLNTNNQPPEDQAQVGA